MTLVASFPLNRETRTKGLLDGHIKQTKIPNELPGGPSSKVDKVTVWTSVLYEHLNPKGQPA
jgi:hypothetical protein